MSSRSDRAPGASDPRPLPRQILALAIPALGALLAEPLFLLADTAIIGRLGVEQLAGAALGITVMHTVTGLMIFLAYSTTPAVARFVGAGRMAKALAAGRDGLWLALILGVVLGLAGLAFGEQLLQAMGSSGDIHPHAWNYLLWSLPGVPAILLVFAATGMLRGLQDTKTPLIIAGAGFGGNIVLNLVLVHPVGMGTAGAALGTSIAQWGMALVYLWLLVPRLRAEVVPLGADPLALRRAAAVGSWMMLRTVSLRVAVVATVLVATDLGPEALAAHQVAFTIFSTLAFVLDALAIAAQALIGRELGASRLAEAKTMTRLMVLWGVGFGVVTGAVTALAAPWLPGLFTPDEQVAAGITAALFVLAAAQPIAGFVFVLDGVLMGAGDVRYLALAGVINLAVYLPVLWLVAAPPQGAISLDCVLSDAVCPAAPGGTAAIVWLWASFAVVYMGARALTLGLRAAGSRWLVLGESR
ncbi:MATE family efflux transporter [Nesterenkonia flava]|uniref:MATE family efflux transporter n=1 Tax=Nesterenkonia flava TaxID=469799 RepID=A0ABU1FSD7_9MICC|nr:MATE family efflux transporter [Nesterenkonia flava]MDR5711544.1 MATE family efflux transporter [Nesterenkonia flava]